MPRRPCPGHFFALPLPDTATPAIADRSEGGPFRFFPYFFSFFHFFSFSFLTFFLFFHFLIFFFFFFFSPRPYLEHRFFLQNLKFQARFWVREEERRKKKKEEEERRKKKKKKKCPATWAVERAGHRTVVLYLSDLPNGGYGATGALQLSPATMFPSDNPEWCEEVKTWQPSEGCAVQISASTIFLCTPLSFCKSVKWYIPLVLVLRLNCGRCVRCGHHLLEAFHACDPKTPL